MNKKRALHLTGILLVGVMLASACTQTYSQTPLGTPTLIPTGLFVSPFPSGQDPLQIIAELGTQTAAAGTVQAGGTVAATGTPGTPAAPTSGTTVAGTPSTETVEATEPTTGGATLLPVTVIPGGSTFTPTTQSGGATQASGTTIVIATSTPGTVGAVPSTYTLQKGEWPYCIARRFNVNPNELLTLNQLTAAESVALNPGLVLSLPQTGNPFPPPRSWHSHPDTYTVDPGDTIGSVACYYGDITPAQIATANNLGTSAALTTGQKLTIP